MASAPVIAASLRLGAASNSFFEGALPGKWDLGRANSSPPISSNPRKAPTLSTTRRIRPPSITRGNRENAREAPSTTCCPRRPTTGHEVSNTARSHPRWGEDGSVLSKLVQANSRPMGPVYHPGLPYTFGSLAKSAFKQHQVGRQPTRYPTNRGAEISRKRSCTMGFIDPGAGGQSNVHCPKKRRRLETNHRLEVSEFSSRAPSLQDGRLVHVTRGSEERVAHGKDRPERRLSNYSDSTGSSVSAILTDRNWEMDTVPMPPIRALYRTVCILKGNKAIDWTPKTAGNPVYYLSRRYSNCLPKHSTTITGSLNSPMANDLSWVPDQYLKEYNVPNPTAGILGVHNKRGEDDNCSPPSQGGSDSERSCTIVGNGISADRDIGAIYWDSSSDQSSSPIGSTTLPSPTTCEITSLESSDSHLSILDPFVPRGTERFDVVENSTSITLYNVNFKIGGLCCHGIRCFQLRLGSSLPGDSYWREVDSLRISLPHQLFGAESSLLSTTDFYETEEQRRGSTKDGQPNRHSLRQQDGRTNPITTLHPSIADLGVVPEAQYHSPRRIPSGERQYRSRLGVTSPEGQQRLATIATGVQNPEQPARSILYRPVCLQDQCPIRALLQLEAGSSSHSSGCLLGVLGTRETIPIPTVQYDRKSSDQDSRRDSRVCLPHSSSLASTDMVSAVVADVGEDANTSAQHPSRA